MVFLLLLGQGSTAPSLVCLPAEWNEQVYMECFGQSKQQRLIGPLATGYIRSRVVQGFNPTNPLFNALYFYLSFVGFNLIYLGPPIGGRPMWVRWVQTPLTPITISHGMGGVRGACCPHPLFFLLYIMCDLVVGQFHRGWPAHPT